MDLAPADLRWLEAAARIAMPYRGTTAENPTVGALVIAHGRVVGRGVTAQGGRPHAETQALSMAGSHSRGATLYVTLEPCNHRGRTPPCVEAVLASGVGRVVCGAMDPDPRTAGQSIARLRAAGVDVEVGSAIAAIERLHEGFLSRIRHGRPFVVAKLAVSRDGAIGRRDFGNVAITGPDAGRWTHMQRALSDALIVGAGTARLDNPRLTVRLAGLEKRRPLRVVIAGANEVPDDLHLFDKTFGQKTVIVKESSYGKPCDDVISVPGKMGRPDLSAALVALGRRGIGRVLVEGGAGLNDALLDAGLIDRFHLLEGEVTIGEDGVAASVHGSLPNRLRQVGFSAVERRALGCDMLTTFEKVQS